MDNELQIIDASALTQMVKAETDTAIETAKKYPRDVKIIKNKVITYATCDQETAASCYYKKPVDNKGTMVEGPSIRLAEIVAACYGNIRYGSRVLEESEKWVTVQGRCFDLENNIGYEVEVKRSIWSEQYKKRYSQNLIQTTIKAAAAIAVRDAIYKVVPMGLFNSELKEIKKKAIGAGDGIPLTQRITNAIAYFKKLGVEEKQILDRLEVLDKAEITDDHLETLIGLKTAIEDKEVTPEEAFTNHKKEAMEAKGENVADSVKAMKADKKGQGELL